MNKVINRFVFFTALLFLSFSCENEGADRLSEDPATGLDEFSSSDSGGGGNGNGDTSGLVTAGEWNDLAHWDFWNNLLNGQDFSHMPEYWGFYTGNRIALHLTNNGLPAKNVAVSLTTTEGIVWETKTDNHGNAELWISLFQPKQEIDLEEYSIHIDGIATETLPQFFSDAGILELEMDAYAPPQEKVEIAFMVDATGSMSDELEFLKDDLVSVISQVENQNTSTTFLTGTVFYRDIGDDYVVRHSDFSTDIATTLEFINAQGADGGGDYPEAVHTALNTILEQLQWSENAKSKLVFMLLDAPPHYEPQVLDAIRHSVRVAATSGIKLIPVSASGIDKETEFLLRFLSVTTNGTYVFITDDSGIGNDHLEPSVGQFEVEKLNALMVRLINTYSE
ncbi:MAG: vWA domain-containing protein [Bacteroidota bacterium]